jgi:hypothetical protein
MPANFLRYDAMAGLHNSTDRSHTFAAMMDVKLIIVLVVAASAGLPSVNSQYSSGEWAADAAKTAFSQLKPRIKQKQQVLMLSLDHIGSYAPRWRAGALVVLGSSCDVGKGSLIS